MMITNKNLCYILSVAEGLDKYTTDWIPQVGWLVGWFYGVSTFIGSFNAELSHFDKILNNFV